MFERFTGSARAAVVGAQREAVREGADEIGTTHLLSALVRDPENTASSVLAGQEITAEVLAEDLRRMRRRAGLSEEDAAALGEFGIDVEEIVERVEQAHGEYALAGEGRTKRRGLFGAREHRQFSGAAKQTLERSLREALDLGDRHIGTEHILLALAQRPGPVSDVLAARGADYAAIRRDVTRVSARPRRER